MPIYVVWLSEIRSPDKKRKEHLIISSKNILRVNHWRTGNRFHFPVHVSVSP